MCTFDWMERGGEWRRGVLINQKVTSLNSNFGHKSSNEMNPASAWWTHSILMTVVYTRRDRSYFLFLHSWLGVKESRYQSPLSWVFNTTDKRVGACALFEWLYTTGIRLFFLSLFNFYELQPNRLTGKDCIAKIADPESHSRFRQVRLLIPSSVASLFGTVTKWRFKKKTIIHASYIV